MTEPQPGLIVSDGRLDFLVHFVRDGWVCGVRYPTEHRGDLRPAPFADLARVSLESWRELDEQVTEVVSA